jgi:hypothetical protein
MNLIAVLIKLEGIKKEMVSNKIDCGRWKAVLLA